MDFMNLILNYGMKHLLDIYYINRDKNDNIKVEIQYNL